MPDPYTRKVYLQRLEHPVLSARHSQGARRRTAQLQQFLAALHGGSSPHLPLPGEGSSAELLVVDRRDWGKLFSYPYGLPFTRTRAERVTVVAAAAYPERLLHRFDDVLVRAAKAGVDAPGDLREFLDLLIGHEWGHAAANLSGLRTGVKWLDELLATYLFLLALRETGAGEVSRRFLAWAEVERAGSGVDRAPLGSFEYPRMKARFATMLWFQGVFTLRAAELLEHHAWDFPLAFGDLPKRRGEVARRLIEVEPSFKPWFSTFGKTEE